MRKIKLSFAAAAFVLTIGSSLVAKSFTAGWYAPSYPASMTRLASPPPDCSTGTILCATDYNANQQVIGTINKPN